MPYKQYTQCISKSDFDSFWNTFGKTQDPLIPLLAWGILKGMLFAFLGALIGAGIGLAAGNVVIGALAGGAFGLTEGFIDGFCDAWLNRRLICVSQVDRCAVGRVAFREFVDDKPFPESLYDNDASLNLRFTPYDGTQFSADASGPDYDWQAMQADGFPGVDLVKRAFADLSYKGYIEGEGGKTYPNNPGGRWTLHCEFEGNGMDVLCKVARFLAVLTTLAAPALMAIGAVVGAIYFGVKTAAKAYKNCRKKCKIPVLCHIACAIAAALAGIAGAAAGFVAGALGGPGLVTTILAGWVSGILGMREDGSFSDAAADPASGTLEEGDCIFAAGIHVYDAGHPDGWHELHPVKIVQKICAHDVMASADCCPQENTAALAPDGTPLFKSQKFKDSMQLLFDRWCNGFQTSQDPLVIAAQDDPENQWCLHPLIDGCERRQEPGRIG